MSGFRITSGKGFHITFGNGWTISAQFGPGNYAGNRDLDIHHDDVKAGERGSATAEIAAWGADGEMIEMPGGDTVEGWATPERVAELIADISAREPTGGKSRSESCGQAVRS